MAMDRWANLADPASLLPCLESDVETFVVPRS